MQNIREKLDAIYLQLRYNALVGLIFGILTSWTIERIADQFVQRPLGVFWVIGGVLMVATGVLLYRFALWILRDRRNQIVPSPGVAPTPKRGLILLFSRIETARKAIEPHCDTLEIIWFILTDETEHKLAAHPNHWWGRAVDSSEIVLNAYSPVETANAIDRAISHARVLGLGPEALACDVTGGTTAMSVGAVAACSAYPGLTLQMVPARYDPELKRPHPLDAIRIDMGGTSLSPP